MKKHDIHETTDNNLVKYEDGFILNRSKSEVKGRL